MKLLLSLLLFVSILISSANADTATVVATVEAQLGTTFSMAFYTDANVLYSTNLPFGTIDTSKSQCKPVGRVDYDGKSDTGVVCLSNLGQRWYLKLKGEPGSSPAFPMQYFQYYMSQPYNRNTGQPSNGTLAQPAAWYSIPTSSTTVYTAGLQDLINTQYGTLSTFNFAIDPQHLTGSSSYIIKITYTLSTSP